MSIYQQIVDFDELFRTLPEVPIIINDLANTSKEDREVINDQLTVRYSTDMISLLPSCRCGETKGEYSSGLICEKCGTVVKSQIEESIQPLVWFRKPQYVNKLINPIIWIMLKNRFKKSGFNILQWLCDTTYRSNVKQPLVVQKIINSGIQRGYNNFVDHFDEIIHFLFNLKDYKVKKGVTEDWLDRLIKENRDKIFFDYIPLPNKSLFIIEKTNLGIYVDPIIIEAIDAISMIVSIDKSFYDQTPRVKENRTVKAISKLTEFYEKFYKINLSPKQGQFRRHIYGTRTNFSFRAVISSLTDTHVYDEIHVPWGVGLTAFRPHLINKLMKRGYDLNSAIGLLWGHIEVYHPLLDTLLKELIAETESNCIYCILLRNPSLLQGSTQRLRITKFKTDPHDRTIGLGILVVKAFNADQCFKFSNSVI